MTDRRTHRRSRANLVERRPVPGALMAAAYATLLHAPAQAQLRPIETSVQTTVWVTNNGAGTPSDQAESDVIYSIQPKVHLERRSAGLSLTGDAEVALLASANKTRPNRALPSGTLNADATLVDRLFFLQSTWDVRQLEADPFATRVDPASTLNAVSTSTFRVSPSLRHEFSPRLSFVARDSETWTRYSGPQADDNRAHVASARLDNKPMPFGWTVDLTDERVYYSESPGADWRTQSVSASANYAIAGEWIVGAVAGTEKSDFPLTSLRETRKGLRLFWSPGLRTELIASADRRFFGNGAELRLRHRTAASAFMVQAVREPTAGEGLRGEAATGGRLETFLDAILTARIPDQAQRAAELAGLMATRGLESALPAAAGVAANYPQLRTGGTATWVMLGRRHTLSVTTYAQQLTQLTLRDGTPLVGLAADADNRQWGGSLGLNRRLSPVTSVDTTARWSRIRGLGTRTGQDSRESLYRLVLLRNLSSKTSASFGLQHRTVDGTSSTGVKFVESVGFVGLNHRF